ncbi:unnamed protein product [Thelazia callipaeda]|uniref:50S ribosomal protein L21 n=1 Tax=Thelazia callipaeda TaxID=103827 RepID=A0A0N5DBC0_THECL|nr:unnamed protein product [Thelazia callipaeda]
MKISEDRPDIMIQGRDVVVVEVGITSQDRMIAVETKKKRKYISSRQFSRKRSKNLIRSVPWIRRRRSSGDQHSRTERGASAARMPEYDPARKSIMKKRRIPSC